MEADAYRGLETVLQVVFERVLWSINKNLLLSLAYALPMLY